MGIVVNQSIKNTLITYLGFGIGAINVLFLFTEFISEEYFGLITFILSTANVLMPLMAFGVHNTIVKFYSSFKTRQQQSSFLSLMLVLPLVLIIPLWFFSYICFDFIANWLSSRNAIVKDYTWLIFISGIAFAYFEIFYAWSKVQLKSVFGNFMKEVFHRACTSILLIALYFDYLTVQELIYSIVGVYILRMLIMKLYALIIRRPVFKIQKIPNLKNILKYTLLIIIAGSVANIILEIDKFMIGILVEIENVAFYTVAIFIASVISVPARSMHQITYPLTAQLLNDNKIEELRKLYKKSSLNLFIIGGFIFLLIILNINQLYLLIDSNYSKGLIVVFVIGLAKLFDNLLGNNNAILFNSNYYRMVLVFGICLAIFTVILNLYFIPESGILGAAYATFIALFIYNLVKVLFVYYKFKMLPFSLNTFKAFLLILICTLVFYFWDFSFHPILNITLKTLIVSSIYGFVVYFFNLSEDISALINKIINR